MYLSGVIVTDCQLPEASLKISPDIVRVRSLSNTIDTLLIASQKLNG